METGNIYSQPELPPPTKPEGPPDVELTAEKARAKVKRDIVGFTTAILVVLGIAIWLISAQEQRHREQSPVPATNAPELLSAPLRLPTNPPPVTFKIENTTFSEGPAPTNTPLDPATLARAMGEVRIANQYLRAEELDSAEEHARQALAIWPDLNAGQRLLGLIYTQRGQFDQAIAVFEKARQTDPANPEVLNNMATAFMQKRMMDKAEELLQTALQLDPGFTVAYLNLGLLFLASGRYEAAADYLERGLARQPGNVNARNNLAVALIRIGRYDEGRAELNRIIEERPDLATAYFNTAIAYLLEGNIPETMNWIQRGADRCNPAILQKYLADPDFNPIRGYPEFQKFMNRITPEVPKIGP